MPATTHIAATQHLETGVSGLHNCLSHEEVRGEASQMSWAWPPQPLGTQPPASSMHPIQGARAFDLLRPLRAWLESIDIRQPELAHRICKVIPAQCPFERDINLFGHTLFHIPPLCKLNPLYDEVVALRFRALCFLADECGEDISSYC